MKTPAVAFFAALTLISAVLAPSLRAEDLSPSASESFRGVYDPGEWTFHAQGSASFGDEAGEIYQSRVGVERHWKNGLAMEISGVAGYFNGEPYKKTEDDDNGALAGFNVLFRWYFHRAENWALYTDVGAGAEWFTSEFPTGHGTSFNFEPQAGMGFTHRIRPEVWFVVGARWHHISNANIGSSGNPGYDAAMPYFGFTWLR